MKLWLVSINGQEWYYPGGTANVAISRLMRYNFLHIKAGHVIFRLARPDEAAEYVKRHPDSRFARSMRKK